mgnify:CR=1 FL=1
MDTYSKVILAMAVLNVLVVAAWMIRLIVMNKKELNVIIKINQPKPLVHAEWQAKRDNQRQAMIELNADFSAVIEGE